MNTSRIAPLLTAVLLLGGVFGAGVYVGYENQPAILKIAGIENKTADIVDTKTDFDIFWKAWVILNEKYVPNGSTSTPETVSDQEKVWGAVAGLTKSLGDPYTVFFKPEQAKLFESEISGHFDGVGMEIGVRDNILTVVSPIKDAPAEKAGIKTGDKILKIDDKETDDMAVDEAVRRIRGKKGTVVRLTVFREKEGLLPEFSITRDSITLPSGEDRQVEVSVPTKQPAKPVAGTPTTPVKPGAVAPTTPTKNPVASTEPEPTGPEHKENIFVIKLYNFGGSSLETFKDKLQKFINSGDDKLILDLRGNPGGYFEAAIEIASFFLPKDAVIVREIRGQEASELLHRSRGYNVFNKPFKMVVLVDRGSASSSEILAGALQEAGVAKLVGERTFGKGSVQELVQLTPDTSLKVTIARWYTPSGKSLSNGGLAPDIESTQTKEDTAARKDTQFDKAVQVLVESAN